MLQAFFGILGFLSIASKSSPPILAPIPQSQIIISEAEFRDCHVAPHLCEAPRNDKVVDKNILAQAKIALDKRWHEKNVNDGFRNNILLSLRYLKMSQIDPNFEPKIGLHRTDLCKKDFGDLASLINWTASEAGLQVEAPIDHSFAEIEGVPRKYWTSVKYQEFDINSQRQNLYVVNNKNFGVRFVFEKKKEILDIKILRS